MIPWQLTEQWRQLKQSVLTPVCTGEDIYLKEGFRPLLEAGAVSVIHPDLATSGGIMETKKIGDMAQDYGVPMAMHMAGSPVSFLANVHCAAATENFYVLENHSVDLPWWEDLIDGIDKPLVVDGYAPVPEGPGLGFGELNEAAIREHLDTRPGRAAGTSSRPTPGMTSGRWTTCGVKHGYPRNPLRGDQRAESRACLPAPAPHPKAARFSQ